MRTSVHLPIKLVFKVYIRADEPLLIGWGYPGITGASISFFRFEPSLKARPIIPGSTIKGVLRTISTKIATILGEQRVCDRIEPGEIRSECDPNDIILRMFGSPKEKYPSALKVSHFEPLSQSDDILMELKHVSIDKSSLRAVKGAFYTEENILPCTVFSGEIILECTDTNSCRRMTELLLLSLVELEYYGLGRGSRRVSVKVEAVNGTKEEIEKLSSILTLELLERLKDFRSPCIR